MADNYFGNICTCRRCNGIIHTIRRGDTLYLLSRHYNVTINDIMRANANVNIYNLQIGDQICIPVRRPEPDNDTPQGQPQRPGQPSRPGQPQRPGQPPRPGQSSRPGQSQRPTTLQPRDDDNDDRVDDLDDLLEDIFEGTQRSGSMQNQAMQNMDMQNMDMQNMDMQDEAMQANAEVSAISDEKIVEASAPCCGGMKVKDVLRNEDMTLEELAKMIKNM